MVGVGAGLLYCRLYGFFRDQGSIIAGLLALVAGVIAYYGSRKAAEAQVSASHVQTRALQEQNEFLTKENRRKLARESLAAIKLVIGALGKIKINTNDLNKRLHAPPYSMPGVGTVTPREIALIPQPDTKLVWQNLGLCGQEIIDKFLLIEKIINDIKREDNLNINYIIGRLNEIINVIEFLDRELEDEAQKCYAVLKD